MMKVMNDESDESDESDERSKKSKCVRVESYFLTL
tara:strand:- start:352 stop:456 length:105 start_codon:yes stop_codon:yes gene_type:complete